MARPRPAEFSSLPTELKSRIFQLVAWQEDAWLARALLDEGMEAVEKNTHVDGLVASSAVSKEWRAFAVEHLFTTVAAHRAQDPAFKYLILRNHADRFTKVILADAPLGVDKAIEQADWEYLLSIIPLLRNARSLVLSVKAADGLFGDELAFDQGAVLSSPQGMRQASFQGIVRTISDLTLLDFSPCKSARTLKACRGLRRLRLENLSAREWEDGSFKALAISLGKMTKLESLDISFTLDVRLEDKWPSDALAALRENPPPISSLRFFHYRHALSDFDFISTFSSTLTHLDLEISCLSDFFPPTILSDPLRQIPLPHLTTLHLTFNDFVADRASLTIFSRLLPSFTSSPVTSLVIRDGSGIDFDLNERCPIRTLGDQIPTLRHFSLTPYEVGLMPGDANYIAAFCARRNLSPPTYTPFDHPFVSSLEDAENDVVCDGLDQVLDFGKLEVGRLRAGGKVADSAAMLESLRPLDAHRRRWRD